MFSAKRFGRHRIFPAVVAQYAPLGGAVSRRNLRWCFGVYSDRYAAPSLQVHDPPPGAAPRGVLLGAHAWTCRGPDALCWRVAEFRSLRADRTGRCWSHPETGVRQSDGLLPLHAGRLRHVAGLPDAAFGPGDGGPSLKPLRPPLPCHHPHRHVSHRPDCAPRPLAPDRRSRARPSRDRPGCPVIRSPISPDLLDVFSRPFAPR